MPLYLSCNAQFLALIKFDFFERKKVLRSNFLQSLVKETYNLSEDDLQSWVHTLISVLENQQLSGGSSTDYNTLVRLIVNAKIPSSSSWGHIFIIAHMCFQFEIFALTVIIKCMWNSIYYFEYNYFFLNTKSYFNGICSLLIPRNY